MSLALFCQLIFFVWKLSIIIELQILFLLHKSLFSSMWNFRQSTSTMVSQEGENVESLLFKMPFKANVQMIIRCSYFTGL